MRDYGVEGMIGLEPTFAEYLARMVAVFEEVKRVLRPTGTCWVNMGDCYANASQPGGGDPTIGKRNLGDSGYSKKPLSGFKPKDLLLMPARLAIALQEAGWWVRSEIIWAKPNPMPESVTDRPTSAHEKIYLLTKSARYFYDADAVREPHVDYERGANGERVGWDSSERTEAGNRHGTLLNIDRNGNKRAYNPAGRNLRNVWTIATQPYPEAHFATFPEELPRKCIMAGTSERGVCSQCGKPWERVTEKEVHANGAGRKNITGQDNMQGWEGNPRATIETKTLGWQPTCTCDAPTVPATVLDIFSGSGTTGLVALKLDRRYIGIELNPDYIALSIKRIETEARQGKLFATEEPR